MTDRNDDLDIDLLKGKKMRGIKMIRSWEGKVSINWRRLDINWERPTSGLESLTRLRSLEALITKTDLIEIESIAREGRRGKNELIWYTSERDNSVWHKRTKLPNLWQNWGPLCMLLMPNSWDKFMLLFKML